MNVACPECGSVFRVDPKKIPSAGVRARCSVCGGVIAIGSAGTIDEEFAAPMTRAAARMPNGIGRGTPTAVPSYAADTDAGRAPVVRTPTPVSSAAVFHAPAPVPLRAPTPARSATPVNAPLAVLASAREEHATETTPAVATTSIAERSGDRVAYAADVEVRRAADAESPPTAHRAASDVAPETRPEPLIELDTDSFANVESPSASPAATSMPTAHIPSHQPIVADATREVARRIAIDPVMTPVAAAQPVAAPMPEPMPLVQPAPLVQPTPHVQPPTVARAAAVIAPPAVRPRAPINPFLANDPNQKAKRLARALVSDIVTYFPDKHREGVRDGTLRELFREEIKKSYEEYCDQMGKDFSESTTHFQDALNGVLAGGKRLF